MKTWLRRVAFVVAVAALLLTFVNASWLAPAPKGGLKMVAHRGVAQLYDHHNLGRDDCTATRIEPGGRARSSRTGLNVWFASGRSTHSPPSASNGSALAAKPAVGS